MNHQCCFVRPNCDWHETHPADFIGEMLSVSRGIRNVIRDDGIYWLALHDVVVDDAIAGVPWRLAFALQNEGWYLRSDIIRFERGQPHEYLFLLTKSARYYYDAEAIKEVGATGKWDAMPPIGGVKKSGGFNPTYSGNQPSSDGMRNRRSVWQVSADEMRVLCIKASTSDAGCCPKCHAPYERITERKRLARPELSPDDPRYRPNRYESEYADINGKADAGYTEVRTLGWKASCDCDAGEPVPCSVFEPFGKDGML